MKKLLILLMVLIFALTVGAVACDDNNETVPSSHTEDTLTPSPITSPETTPITSSPTTPTITASPTAEPSPTQRPTPWAEPPWANFDVNIITPLGEEPVMVQFSNKSFADDCTFNNNVTNWIVSTDWTFGDGTTSNERNPLHIYSEQGVYNASLTVTDYIGQTADYEITLFLEAPSDSIVTFPDPDLEAAIRYALPEIPEGDIYESHLEHLVKLTNLNEDGSVRGVLFPINNLTGLEYCPNLKYLEIHSSQTNAEYTISEIAPLSNLHNLTILIIPSNEISDLSPLADLTNLTRIDLLHGQVSDISALSNLIDLEVLDLRNNYITDISPLSNLTKLKKLYLSNNQIKDISALANLNDPTLLVLDGNQINDISPIFNNVGIDEGDVVFLRDNPLNEESVQMRSELYQRGVELT